MKTKLDYYCRLNKSLKLAVSPMAWVWSWREDAGSRQTEMLVRCPSGCLSQSARAPWHSVQKTWAWAALPKRCVSKDTFRLLFIVRCRMRWKERRVLPILDTERPLSPTSTQGWVNYHLKQQVVTAHTRVPRPSSCEQMNISWRTPPPGPLQVNIQSLSSGVTMEMQITSQHPSREQGLRHLLVA